MPLLIRTFLSKPGRGPQLIGALQNAATTMIQTRQADSVLLCQQSDTGERILWFENSRGTAGAPALDKSLDLLEQASMARPLEFLDGFYRFPMPSCQVWSLEVQAPSNGQSPVHRLLRLARSASADPTVVGLSVYRDVDDPTLFIAFLALLPGVPPEQHFSIQLGAEPEALAIERTLVWHPLSVSWTMGRLSSAGGYLLSSTRYPSTAFWARSGQPLAQGKPLRAELSTVRGGDEDGLLPGP